MASVYSAELTPLQKHCAYFDRNKDGVITPCETWAGFRALGYNIIATLVATVLVHLFFSYATLDTWVPDPFFSIHIKNVHRCVHGSHTNVYDHNGNVRESELHTVLNAFATTSVGGGEGPDAAASEKRLGLSLVEGWRMTEMCRNAWDPVGWVAAKLEWFYLWLLAAENGVVPREAIRAQYDGRLFEYVEQKRKIAAK